jgi:hypothetical protein
VWLKRTFVGKNGYLEEAKRDIVIIRVYGAYSITLK